MNVWTNIYARFIQLTFFSQKLKKKKIQPKLSFPRVLRSCIVLKKKNWLHFHNLKKNGYGKNKIVPIKANCFQTSLYCLAPILYPPIWMQETMTD